MALADLKATLQLQAEQFMSGIESALSSFGNLKSVLMGGIAASPFAAVVASAMQMDEAMDRLSAKTGATGAALEGLGQTVQSVMKAVPASMAESANAVGSFSTRLGLTGEALKDITTKVGLLSDRMGTGFTATADEAARTFAAWNISTDKQSRALDFLLGVSQRTGTGITELMGSTNALRPITEALGLSFEKTAAFVGQLNQNAIPVGPVMYGLRTIMKQFTDEGVDTRKGLEALFTAIRNMEEGSKEAQQAMQLFGARGQALFAAIKSGKLDIDALTESVQKSGETVEDMSKRTRSFGDIMGELERRVQLIGVELGKDFVDVLGKLADMLIPVLDYVEKLAKQFGELPDNIQVATLAFLALGAALTPILGPINALIVAAGGAALAFKAVDLTKPTQDVGLFGDRWNAVTQALNAAPGFIEKPTKSLLTLGEVVTKAWNTLRDLANIVVSLGAAFRPVFDTITSLALKFYEAALVPMGQAFGSLLHAIAPVAEVIGGVLYVAIRMVADVLKIMLNPAFEVLGTMMSQAGWVFKNILSPAIDFAVGGLKKLVEWLQMLPGIGPKIKEYVDDFNKLKTGVENAASGATRTAEDNKKIEESYKNLIEHWAEAPDHLKRFNDAVKLLDPALEGMTKKTKGAGDAAADAAVKHMLQAKALEELGKAFSALGMKDTSEELAKLERAYAEMAKSGKASSEELAVARDNIQLLQDQLKETPQRMAFSVLGVNTDSLKTAYDALQQLIGQYKAGAITLPVLNAAQDSYNKKLSESVAAAEKALPSTNHLRVASEQLAAVSFADIVFGLKEFDVEAAALNATLTKAATEAGESGDFIKTLNDAIDTGQQSFKNFVGEIKDLHRQLDVLNAKTPKTQEDLDKINAILDQLTKLKFDPTSFVQGMAALVTQAELLNSQFSNFAPVIERFEKQTGFLDERFKNLAYGIPTVNVTITELKDKVEKARIELEKMSTEVDDSGKAIFTEGQIRQKNIEYINAQIEHLKALGPAYDSEIEKLEDQKRALGEVITVRQDMARLGVTDIQLLGEHLNKDVEAYQRLASTGKTTTQVMEAQIHIFKEKIEIDRAMGRSTDDLERVVARLEERVKGHSSIWRTMATQVSTIINDLGKQVAEGIIKMFDTSANDSLDQQAEDLRKALDEQTAQYEKHVTDLKATFEENTANAKEELDKQLADLIDSLNEKQLAYDRSVEDLKTRYERETRELNEALDDRQRDYQHWVEDQRAKLRELEGDNSESAKRQTNDILRELKQRAEDEADYARDIATKRGDLESDYKTSLQRQTDDFEKFKGDIALKQDEANDEYRTKLSEQTADLQKQLDDARAEYEKFKIDNKAKLEEIQSQHKSTFDRIKEMFGDMLTSMGEALLRFGTEMLVKLLIDKLKSLADVDIPAVGKSFMSVFGKGGTADNALGLFGDRWSGIVKSLGIPGLGTAGTLPGGIDLGYTVPGASGASGTAGAAVSGISGTISSISGIASAVGSIGSMLMSAFGSREEGTLNAIEGNTRYLNVNFSEIFLGQYWPTFMTAIYAIHDELVNLGASVGGMWTGISDMVTIFTQPKAPLQTDYDTVALGSDTNKWLADISATLKKDISVVLHGMWTDLDNILLDFNSFAVQLLKSGIGSGAGGSISLPGGDAIAPSTPIWQVPAQLGVDVIGENTPGTPAPIVMPRSSPTPQATLYDMAMQSRAIADAMSKPATDAMSKLGDIIARANTLITGSLGTISPGTDQAFKDMIGQLQGLSKTAGLTPDQLGAITDEIIKLIRGPSATEPARTPTTQGFKAPLPGEAGPTLQPPPVVRTPTPGTEGFRAPLPGENLATPLAGIADKLQPVVDNTSLTVGKLDSIDLSIQRQTQQDSGLPGEIKDVITEIASSEAGADSSSRIEIYFTSMIDGLRGISENFEVFQASLEAIHDSLAAIQEATGVLSALMDAENTVIQQLTGLTKPVELLPDQLTVLAGGVLELTGNFQLVVDNTRLTTEELGRIDFGIQSLTQQESQVPNLLSQILGAVTKPPAAPSVTVIVQGNLIGNEAAADDIARLISNKLRIQGVPA